jgi:hypothetical protein
LFITFCLRPLAEGLLARYADHPQCLAKDKVLPILSNQKMNAYLKEIAERCGTIKRLTFRSSVSRLSKPKTQIIKTS